MEFWSVLHWGGCGFGKTSTTTASTTSSRGNSTANTDSVVLIAEEVTRDTLAAFYTVYNKAGYGFLESVYVSALEIELTRLGWHVEREVSIAAKYDGKTIGAFRIDLLVDRRLIVEVKADSQFTAGPERQLMNYLRCSDLEVGLLLVFGLTPRFKRLIHTRDRKLNTNKGS